MGLSRYMVCREGASKPVSHMSRTMTILNVSSGSRKRLASDSRRDLDLMCCCQSGETALVVDGVGGPVLDGALDVVDAYVVAEDRVLLSVSSSGVPVNPM